MALRAGMDRRSLPPGSACEPGRTPTDPSQSVFELSVIEIAAGDLIQAQGSLQPRK